MLRIKGRLDNAELYYSEKHPLIVPKGRSAELVVRFQHILQKHAGVTQLITSLHGIIGLRRIAKKVKGSWLSCQKLDSQPVVQPTAPLPGSRVQQSAPFSVIGIDHAGYLYCSDYPGRKFYSLLITWAVVRAMHLELVRSLGVEDCMYAL